ncbi:MAG: CoA-binding protein [Bdellovibrionales bacterium]|nr:CoA-binding protein [Bdellovibrionales bacterium]
MGRSSTDQNLIKEVLEKYKKVTVVGISSKPSRASYGVTEYLLNQGFEVDGVNPVEKSILGCSIYASLKQVPHKLEIVDVFRAPEHVLELVNELIPLRPQVLWLQEGVTHLEAEERARQAGIVVISDKCILKEHRRLFLIK